MSERFDPYHEWLGIPAEEQPPNYYRLLGVPALETSASVIENAANQRMAHLRTLQTGKHGAESQRLLNEVAAARVCLLKPEKKAAYDDALRRKLAASASNHDQTEGVDAELAAIFAAPLPAAAGHSGISSKRPAKKRAEKSSAAPALVVAVGGLAAAAALLGWAVSHSGGTGGQEIAKAPDPAAAFASSAKGTAKSSKPARNSSALPASSDTASTAAPAEPAEPVKPDASQTPPSVPASPLTPAPKEEAAEAEKVPAKKVAPPSKDEQSRLVAEIDEVYKPSQIADPTAKAALARKLLDEGRRNGAHRGEQFVFFRRAGEIARDAGDAELMLEAVDAMATAGFDIRPTHLKAWFLKQLIEQSFAGAASRLSAASASCVKFAQEAATADAMDEAAEVIDAANSPKSFTSAIARAQAVWRTAKAALAHARAPEEEVDRQKKVDDAEAELTAVRSAQASVAECAAGLQKARREREAIAAARERLKSDPKDAQACLTIGRWLCFQQGDWEEGLRLLAKGSDDGLKALAADELASKPAKAEEKIARGDAWWDLAEKSAAGTKAGLRRRAAHWYEEAAAGLPPGLQRTKVEQRLAEVAKEPEPPPQQATARDPQPPKWPFNERIAKQYQASWARHLHVPVLQTNSIGMKLVLIPPGEFEMGSTKELIEEEQRGYSGGSIPGGVFGWYREQLGGESPAHRVRVKGPFWLGATAVTQDEYERVMGGNPSQFRGTGRPVENVSWDEAVQFCRKLSELPAEKAAGRSYGLPTEAQWEYACRAGSGTRFSFGDDDTLLPQFGWSKENSNDQTQPVALEKPNPWNLHDMHGNVWQWCQDWYSKDYYATFSPSAPADDVGGPPGGSERVIRGGSAKSYAISCRSAYRFSHSPGTRSGVLGFRVAVVGHVADDTAPLVAANSANSTVGAPSSESPRPDEKPPVPSDEAQAHAMKLVKEVYGPELAAAKTLEQKKALAKKLLEKAEGSTQDRAGMFALLKAAQGVALQAADAESVFEAIGQMAECFDVDPLALTSEAITALAAKSRSPAEHAALAAAALAAIDRAVAADKFAAAAKLGDTALQEARKARNAQQVREAERQVAEIRRGAKLFEAAAAARATLEKSPDDTAANLALGRFECFVKGDWEKGLPRLAIGGDDDLKSVASADLKGASTSAERTKLGDAWWDLAAKDENLAAKRQLQARAAYWYRLALPDLTGLSKDRVAKRLQEVDEPQTPQGVASSPTAPPAGRVRWVLLFRSSDPTVWNTDSPARDRFAVPLSNAPDKTRYLKFQRDPQNFVIIAITKGQLAGTMESGAFGWQGTNTFAWGGHELGIFDRSHNAHREGNVAIKYDNSNGFEYSGWGFGYANHQGYAWEGKPIEKAIFEISVTATSLTSLEKKHLLN